MIDSYDNYKKESHKAQQELKEKIHEIGERELKMMDDKEVIIKRLNNEIQEEIKTKMQLDHSL